MHSIRRGRRRALAAFAILAGLAPGCGGDGSQEATEEFAALYVRLLRSRENPASGDTLRAEEVARLEELVRRADLEPEEWSALLTRIRDEAREGNAPADGATAPTAE